MNVDTMLQELQDDQDGILELNERLQERSLEYKEKMKVFFGISIGETLDVLQLMKAIKRISSNE